MASPLSLALNHVVLPPNLPGQADPNPIDVETVLFKQSIAACDDIIADLDTWPRSDTLQHVYSGFLCLRRILNQSFYAHGDHLDCSRVVESLRGVTAGCEAVILFVREQNAGLIIRWSDR